MKQHFCKQIGIALLLCILTGKDSQNNGTVFHDYFAISMDGDTILMEEYKNRKILLVNVASKCGYTPQYEGLQFLHKKYGNELAILGFPSNDFLWQEPGNNLSIITFCQREYGVSFQMFEKIHVKGKRQHPIYNWVSDSKLNGWNDDAPSWNFCKYLIDEKGRLIEFYKSKIEPTDTLITRYLNTGDTIHPLIKKN